jgi:hypothetical protein
MKNAPVLIIIFYLALAVCLWPLYLAGSQVVTYVQAALAAHKLAALPPGAVLIAAAQSLILVWAIAGAVVLYRRGQDSFGWLIIVLVLTPTLVQLASKYI